MENNKYYIPEISEFYVGFEFEEGTKIYKKYPDDFMDRYYRKIVSTTTCLIDIDDKINNRIDGLIRVKYLDKEDIESLGWVLKDNYYYKNNLKLIWGFNTIIIWEGSQNMLCKIPIKNKSELKKLMKQLNIID